MMLLASFDFQLSTTHAQGTAFTYQGRLNSGTNVATGNYDFSFAIFNAVTGGTQQGGGLTNATTAVSNGLFTVTLDFGNQFPGAARWLEMAVRTNGGGAFTTLAPRQPLTPTPYAVFANTASNLTGTVPLAQLPASLITNGASGVNFSGTFSGNGSGVTNLNLALSSGGVIASSGGFRLTASPVVGSAPRSVIAVDVNSDGKLDLICANSGTNSLSVLTNNGSGGFVLATTPGVGVGAYAVTSADVNSDGKIDLICVNYGSGTGNTLSVMTNKGGGNFVLASSPIVGNGPDAVTSADVNGDGKIDLVSANIGVGLGTNLTVLTNNGSGGFVVASSPLVGIRPLQVVAAELNGDGKPDLVTANFAGTVSVLTNSGAGNFVLSATLTVGGTAMAILAADMNADGKVDLISEDTANEILTVLTNNGSGNFATFISTGMAGAFSITAADVDLDGRPDLIGVNRGANTLTILTNAGNGNFGAAVPPIVGAGPVSVVAADLNGDGKPDLVCANSFTNTLSVLFNVPTVNGIFNGVINGTGRISSPMWNATTPINISGGLTINGQFTSGGGTLVFSVSGSGYCSVAGPIGMNILLDGVVVDNCQIFANAINTHLAFVPKTFVRAGVAAGNHTLSLQPFAGTLSNVDNYCVTVLEFPF